MGVYSLVGADQPRKLVADQTLDVLRHRGCQAYACEQACTDDFFH